MCVCVCVCVCVCLFVCACLRACAGARCTYIYLHAFTHASNRIYCIVTVCLDWSAPAAIAVAGLGGGFEIGAEVSRICGCSLGLGFI